MDSVSLTQLVAVSVPFSFLTSKIKSRWVRYLASGALSLSFVVTPFLQNLPTSNPNTMMTGVFAFCAALKTNQMLLFRKTTEEEATHSLPRQFVHWVGEFFWVACPIVKIQDTAKSWADTLAESCATFLGALAKVVSVPLLHKGMLQLCDQAAKPVGPLYGLWAILVLVSMWPQDMLHSIVHLFSRGRYGVIAFNNFPLLSGSLYDFWSRRYNMLIRTFLHETVFTPARETFALPSETSAMLTFGVSGVLHGYVARLTFGHGAVPALFFFLIHGAAVFLDKKAHKTWVEYTPSGYREPTWLRVVRAAMVPGLFIATYPLYPALFVNAMPGWLYNSPPPEGAFKPLTDITSSYLAPIFGIRL